VINLMPSEIRTEILYARRNTRLLKWLLRIVLATTCIVALTLLGVLIINATVTKKAKQNTQLESQLAEQGLEETQKRIQTFTGNLKLVDTVLSKEILFSKVLQQVGAAMPANTKLSGLKVEASQRGLDITAYAADKLAASQIQVNLEDPKNRVFEQVDIIKITCGTGVESTEGGEYPCSGNYRALFNKNNQFLFINDAPVGILDE